MLFFLRFKHHRYVQKSQSTTKEKWSPRVQTHLPKMNFASRRAHHGHCPPTRTRTTNHETRTGPVCRPHICSTRQRVEPAAAVEKKKKREGFNVSFNSNKGVEIPGKPRRRTCTVAPGPPTERSYRYTDGRGEVPSKKTRGRRRAQRRRWRPRLTDRRTGPAAWVCRAQSNSWQSRAA